jgi:steroid delta-isomerase-like uncharacterized protein
MPDILHRISIDVPQGRVHDMLATKAGLEQWWSGHPVAGDDRVGGKLAFYFGRADPGAVMEVLTDTPNRIAWRCHEGPADWVDTTISFDVKPAGENGGTTVVFSHAGWKVANEFMNHCSTHWASYLIGMRAGLEGGTFTPFPKGEVSLWAPQSTTERDTSALSDIIKIITRFEHAFRAGDQATIDELCDPGLVDHNPAPEQEPTLTGFKRKVAGYVTVFPDIEEDLQDIVASGDTAATRWVMSGSQLQDFMGIPATGQTVRVEGMNFYRLKDGLVTDIWTQFDGVGLMQQLGAIPA